jgi:hypothetical protein
MVRRWPDVPESLLAFRGDAEGGFVLGAALGELRAPLLPEGRQVEAGRALERGREEAGAVDA